MLLFRNVGFLPLWTLIEYMQLIAFMPIYNFKLIPYLYDAFKPFLISHLILFNNNMIFKELDDDYFNINYFNYELPISKLVQSLLNIGIMVACLLALNLAFVFIALCFKSHPRLGPYLAGRLGQFKFNVYIRIFMLIYFDFTFFSVMKI